MKKIQVVLVAVAVTLAAAGVYANTLNSFVYWRSLVSTGGQCSELTAVVGSLPSECNIEETNPCVFIETFEGQTNKQVYYSRQELDNNGVEIACIQLKKE